MSLGTIPLSMAAIDDGETSKGYTKQIGLRKTNEYLRSRYFLRYTTVFRQKKKNQKQLIHTLLISHWVQTSAYPARPVLWLTQHGNNTETYHMLTSVFLSMCPPCQGSHNNSRLWQATAGRQLADRTSALCPCHPSTPCIAPTTSSASCAQTTVVHEQLRDVENKIFHFTRTYLSLLFMM